MADQPPIPTARPIQFTTGSGELFTAQDAQDAQNLRDVGLHEITDQETHHEELRKQYSSWMYAATAATLGAVHSAAPGATGAALTGLDAISHGAAQGAADFVEGVQAGNPVAYGGGMLAGALVPGAATLVAEVGSPGAAAAVGAASFAGMTYDDLALKHINTPEGAEKTAAALAKSAAWGAGLGVIGFGVGAVIAKRSLSVMGAKLEAGAVKTLSKETIGNPGVAARLEETGAVQQTNDLMQKYDLVGKGKTEVQRELTRIATKAEKAMQEAKSVTTETVPMAEQLTYARRLQQAVGDTPGVIEQVAGAPFREPQTVSELHAFRMELDSKINWGEIESPLSQRMIAARDIVDEQITKTFQHASEVTDRPDLVLGQLSRWQTATEELQASKALQDALKHSEATGKSFIQTVGGIVSGGGKAAITGGVMSLNPAATAAGVAAYAGGKVIQNLGPAAAQGLRGVGKMMQAFDGAFLRSVLGETAGTTTARLTAGAGALGLADYQPAAASVLHATEDPAAAVQKMAEHLAEKKVPGTIIDAAVPQNIRAVQYLSTQVPKSPWTGKTVAPTPWKPTLKQMTAYLDQVDAIGNPLRAFEVPTPLKMEAVKAVYPIMAQKAAMIASQYAAARADLSRWERQRLSIIAGLPASPLASPQSQAIMAQVNAAAQQQMAQGQGGQTAPQRRGSATGQMVSFADNQLGRMAGNRTA